MAVSNRSMSSMQTKMGALWWYCVCLLSLPLCHSSSPDDWYKKYPAYPPYCSLPEQMATRSIPPLTDDPAVGDTRLVHVTTIIRHGARTPWSNEMKCWDGYWESPDTGIWDCDLTTLLAPPDPKRIQQLQRQNATSELAISFLFEKHYDALLYPLKNRLNGTCQQGQLLMRGYQQELQNGQILREAYLFDSTQPFDHNIRMRLLDVSGQDYLPWQSPQLHFRSDDDQRTLMSGQVFLRGMLGPELLDRWSEGMFYPKVALHTADRDVDVMDPNPNLCPRLQQIRTEAETSSEFQDFHHLPESKTMRKFMHQRLGTKEMEDDIMDCLMTTICTDRDLPNAINDYTGGERRLHSDDSESSDEIMDETNMFQRLVDYYKARFAIHMRYNDAEYSKLAIGPLWAEIMDNILPIVQNTDLSADEDQFTKLALFSGHDTTIIPLLASLGPTVWDGTEWPHYASLLNIEIHELIDGSSNRNIYPSLFAFRLVFNGNVITSRLDGCPNADLCDVSVLVNKVQAFATRDIDCGDGVPEEETNLHRHSSKEMLTSTSGLLALMLAAVLSFFVGSIGTFVYLTGQLPFGRRHTHYPVGGDEPNGIALKERNGGYRDEPGNGRYTDEPGTYSDEPGVFSIGDEDDPVATRAID